MSLTILAMFFLLRLVPSSGLKLISPSRRHYVASSLHQAASSDAPTGSYTIHIIISSYNHINNPDIYELKYVSVYSYCR